MIGSLSELEMKNLLTSQAVGRIACAEKEKPYIVPVTYTYDGKYIYGQSNEGTKLKILRKNPAICFEVDTMIDMRNWKSVVVFGEFEELKDEAATIARNLLFSNVFPLLTSSTIHAHEHHITGEIDDSTRIKYIMYRIKILKMTGRYEKQ